MLRDYMKNCQLLNHDFRLFFLRFLENNFWKFNFKTAKAMVRYKQNELCLNFSIKISFRG